jgi:YHS domain-containing protein
MPASPNLSRAALLALLAAVIGLAGCAPFVTQSPGQGLSPVNAVAQGDDKHLMLFGHDVVSYFTENTHRMGQPTIKSVHKGVSFWFSKPEHKALFDAAPDKYIPQFGGYCANGIVYGIPWGGDADSWRIVDGKLYIFGGRQSREAFLLDVPGNRKLAEQYWSTEVNGSNAFFQRTKRLTLRVPHYKSGADLQAMIDAAAKK